MTQFQKISLFMLRVGLGWMFLYAGMTKVLNPAWSAEKFLNSAKTFNGFYQWLATPSMLPITNFMNEWGLTLLGISLILGIGVRLSSILGAILMALYYFPILQFPYPNPNSYIVDQHIIFIFALLFLASIRAGRVWGLESWCSGLPVCSKYPKFREWIG